MDLHTTLPEFPVDQHAHTISKLERAQVTVKELLLFDALEVAKKTGVGVTDVRKLASQIIDALHKDTGLCGQQPNEDDAELLLEEGPLPSGNPVGTTSLSSTSQLCISSLDRTVDAALGGGIPAGYVTEIAGESGCGKTQLLLHLLLAVQLPSPHGLARNALYISTESELSTTRLTQLLSKNSYISSLPPGVRRPSLENIRSITAIDLESQDHILNFQVPIAVERYDVGLVVVDSVTANYRAELSAGTPDTLVTRSRELKQLGHFLRNLAVKYNLAVVVANQVSDQFGGVDDPLWTEEVDGGPGGSQAGTSFRADTAEKSASNPLRHADRLGPSPLHHGHSQHFSSSPTPAVRGGPLATQTSSPPVPDNNDPNRKGNTMSLTLPGLETTLTLEHQKPFFTGWGDPYVSSSPHSNLKTPALGVVWSNQIGCRIVLKVKKQELPPEEGLSGPNVTSIRGNTGPHVPPSASIPQKSPSIPDSEDSEEFEIPPEIEVLISASNLEHPTQPQEVIEHKGSATGADKNTTVNQEGLAASSPAPLHTPRTRKVRVLEVVFAPWMLGIARHDDNPDDAWEDVVEGERGNKAANAVRYESPFVGVAEFEILPSGIRGLDMR